MEPKIRKSEALAYHESSPSGKIEVIPSKPLSNQHDLALAYSPGVAEPCKEIAKNTSDVYKYTAKGNLVGVVSNGTAVLGLGNIGPEAAKPVMEGKGVLFKKFAGIDVFDIEIAENDPHEFIKILKSLEPTFGGINLEDIKAPESFLIERTLRDEMNIPVMHDDQHGTAIISSAALLNALDINGKKLEEIKIVVSGAGAAAMACIDLYVSMGAHKENIIMLDSKGVIKKNRENLDELKSRYATDRDLDNLNDAMEEADMFLGLSKGNILDAEDLKKMARDPIVFALANPDPEVDYNLAIETREDIIMATGRSDHPNQVNNVLGFPYIFRGSLDVRAKSINEEMKMAAVHALVKLAREPVPEIVLKAYGSRSMKYGKNYLIPKPLDPRLITTISPAVAKAAMDSNVAQKHIDDWDKYELELKKRVGIDQSLLSRIVTRARKKPKKVVFAEADDVNVLKAAQLVVDEGIAVPILLGSRSRINEIIEECELELGNCHIINPLIEKEKVRDYAKKYFDIRQRKGVTLSSALDTMVDRNYFGAMMVECDEADALISGRSSKYPKTILPALEIIGIKGDIKRVAGMYIINTKKGTYFFSDTTVNIDPTVDELIDIIGLTARTVKYFDAEPHIAMLSYSNFGSAKGETPQKVSQAVKKAKLLWPDLIIDGDIQANVALNGELLSEHYPFSELNGKTPNTLIFPNLAAGNIGYKLVMDLGGSEAIGPILMGMKKSVHVLQFGSSVREIFDMVAIAVVDAQQHELNNE